MFVDTTKYPTSALGPGWRHTYEKKLTFFNQVGGEPDTLILEGATGNRLRFYYSTYTADSGGGFALIVEVYQPARGVYATLTHDHGNNRYVLTNRDLSVEYYDATTGKLTEQRDAQGHRQVLTYYNTPGQLQHGQLQEVKDIATNRTLTFTYIQPTLPNGQLGPVRLSAVKNQLNQGITFTYFASDGLLTPVYEVYYNGVKRYTYDYDNGTSVGNLITMVKNGPIDEVSNLYVNGRISQQMDAYGMLTAYAQVSSTDYVTTTITTSGPIGTPIYDVTKHIYRVDGTFEREIREGQGQGSMTQAGDSLAPTSATDARGYTTQTQNNSVGQPTDITDALGGKSEITYNAKNLPIQIVSPDGITTTLDYNTANAVTRMVRIGSPTLKLTTLYSYTADLRLDSEQGPDGVVAKYIYDTLGQLQQKIVAYGSVAPLATYYVYDVLGRVTDVTEGYGTSLATTTHTEYNFDNSVSKVTRNYQAPGTYNAAYPDRNVWTQYGYDSQGRNTWTKEVDGHYSNFNYYSNDRVVWTVANPVDGSGVPFIPSGPTPPAFSPSRPDANVSTSYQFDQLGRLVQTAQTGILTGTFNTATRQFSAATTIAMRIEYDEFNRPVTTTLNYRPGEGPGVDRNVKTYTYYDASGNPIWQSDPLGNWTKTDYDGLNRPITVTLNYEDGIPEANELDRDIISINRYAANGRLLKSFENYQNGLFTVTEPITDRITVPTYDALGRIVATSYVADSATLNNPAYPETNRNTVNGFDPAKGLADGTRDLAGRWTALQFDNAGRVIASVENCTNASGASIYPYSLCHTSNGPNLDRNLKTQTAYDARWRVIQTTNPAGVKTFARYDGLGRTIATIKNYVAPGTPTSADTNVTSLTAYNGLSQVVSTTNALGKITRMTYDGLGRQISVTDPTNAITEYGYDGQGTQRWSKDAGVARFTVSLVDGLGRPVKTIENYQNGVVDGGDGTDRDLIASQRYDSGGRVISSIDPGGRETRFAYDRLGRLVAVQENALDSGCAVNATDCNLITSYEYDRVGNRTAILDPRGNHQRITTYNAANWPTKEVNAIGNQQRWTYNRGGDVVLHYTGVVTRSYTYNARSQVILGTTPDAKLVAQYDLLGRRTAMGDHVIATPTDPITVSETYDALGRVTQAQQYVSNPMIATYAYDALGERTRVTSWPENRQIDYTYTSRGELSTVKEGAATLATYGYDQDGWLRTLDLGATTTLRLTRTPDAAGRLTTMAYVPTGTSTPLLNIAYALNRRGERLNKTESRNGVAGLNETYIYDGVGRMSSHQAQGEAAYVTSYDRAGNRLSQVYGGGGSSSWSYNAANQLSGSGYQYDGAGQATLVNGKNMTYDGFGRMIRNVYSGTTTNYRYAMDGTLVRAEANYTAPVFQVTKSHMIDWAAPLAQILATTSVQRDPTCVSKCTDTSSTQQWVYGTDRLLQIDGLLGGARKWQLSDGLGSLLDTTANGTTLGSAKRYTPWGVQTAGTKEPFGFAGELRDLDNGLVYLRARWYDPATARFTSIDPFKGDDTLPYSLHAYQYGYSNPVSNTDPTGKQTQVLCVPIAFVDSPLPGPADALAVACAAGVTIFEWLTNPATWTTISNALDTCTGIWTKLNTDPTTIYQSDHPEQYRSETDIPDEPVGKLRNKPDRYWEKQGIDPHAAKDDLGNGARNDLFVDDDGNVWTKYKDNGQYADDSYADYLGTLEDLAEMFPAKKKK